MKLNKIDEVWNNANPIFKWRFDLLSSRNFATMETCRKRLLLSIDLIIVRDHNHGPLIIIIPYRDPINTE